jgi:hypothetical protein
MRRRGVIRRRARSAWGARGRATGCSGHRSLREAICNAVAHQGSPRRARSSTRDQPRGAVRPARERLSASPPERMRASRFPLPGARSGRTPSVSARRAAHARFRQAKRQRGVLRTRRGGRGFPLVLDCVGTDATMALDAATVSVRRLGHGHRRRRRDIATDVRDTAVRSSASPTLTGAARSSSPRSSSSRGPAASTRTWRSTCRSSGQPRRASGCARARSTGRAVIMPNGCGRLVRPRRRRPRCAGA